MVLLSPLVLIFGAGVFCTLMDHIVPPAPQARRGAAGVFVLIMCAPLLLTLLGPLKPAGMTPYAPLHLQRIAGMMRRDEFDDERYTVGGGMVWGAPLRLADAG